MLRAIASGSGGGGGGVTSVQGTANRIAVDSTNPASPIVNIDPNYVGQNTITTVGTIGTGVWEGTVIGPDYVRHSFATPVSVGTGTSTVNITNGDFHHVTATGAFTLNFSMSNGQIVVVRGIDFDNYAVTISADWGSAGVPTWTGKDDFVVYRDGSGNYIAAVVVLGIT